MSISPVEEYRVRLDARRTTYHALERVNARLGYVRLGNFALAVAVALAAWRDVLPATLLLVPLFTFVALVVHHDRVIRARDAAARAITFYERGLARIEDRWIGAGEAGEHFRDDTHPYANDLDLFGRGSLFELLSIARTRAGEATLARWLTSAADRAEITRRHDAVRELTPALDLREGISLAGLDVRAGVDGDALISWASSSSRLGPLWIRTFALCLTTALLVVAAYAYTTGATAPLVVLGSAQLAFMYAQRRAVERTLHASVERARDLDILSHLLEQIERAAFTSPALVEIRQRVQRDGAAASRAIRALHRLVEMHDWTHNVVFVPIALGLMWDVHIAWAVERWRRTHGRHIAAWLEAVGQLEALLSLSAYRYEHPEDPFPEIVPATSREEQAHFAGIALGHPLLPTSRMIRNDVSLSADQRLLVISGSNMSGKSTLLRTVGINAVMALAGAPVRATSLRIGGVAVGATLRIQDSLQEGRSRFYAEITRVRQLADIANGPRPLLFLLDEIFHGTNSHDRRVGAAGVLRSLLERGAIGLVTTHDLTLTAIADDLGAHAANVHFDDDFQAGELVFDYRMKQGPVTRSNAIALMRAVGLAVEESE